MKFHEANSIPEKSSNEIKICFQDDTHSSKRTSTPEPPVPIHKSRQRKTVLFFESEKQTLAENIIDTDEQIDPYPTNKKGRI